MAEVTEKTSLITRSEFREVEQEQHGEEAVVQCCCLESRKLGRVPIIRTLFKKKDPSEKV